MNDKKVSPHKASKYFYHKYSYSAIYKLQKNPNKIRNTPEYKPENYTLNQIQQKQKKNNQSSLNYI